MTTLGKRQTRNRFHQTLLPWLKRWYQQDMVKEVKRRVRRGSSRHKVEPHSLACAVTGRMAYRRG